MAGETEKIHADYTEGSILGSILKMGLPSMFGFLTQNIYTIVDTWWVSRLPSGEAAVAGLTFFAVILSLLFSFNQLVGPGSVAVISRRYGEKNYDQTEKAIKETILLKLLFGFVFGITGYFFTEDLLRLVGARGESLRLGVQYARIMFVALGIPYATYSIFTALRSVANPRMAMILMVVSNLLNMALDPVFIFGYFGFPALGIRGAAIASIISFALTLTAGLVLFYTGRTNLRLHLRGKAALSLETMWQLVRIGVPAWLGSVSFTGSRLLITPMIAMFGTSVVAAYGVGAQIFGFGIMIIIGIGLGLSSLIGHNLGGGKIERARKTGDQAILLSVGIMIVFGAIMFTTAELVMGLFFRSPETIGHGVTLLRIYSLAFPFFGVFLMIEEIHVGVGLNAPMMVFTVIHSWLLQVVPVFLITTVFHLNQVAVWWAMMLAGCVTAAMVYAYYRRGRWLTVKV
ncbi:MAG TPA: MATE family efflux transporter [Acidobacteriota bacterium]|nr:MATE family efflux transporter [Acidobacteriota bacterium]